MKRVAYTPSAAAEFDGLFSFFRDYFLLFCLFLRGLASEAGIFLIFLIFDDNLLSFFLFFLPNKLVSS